MLTCPSCGEPTTEVEKVNGVGHRVSRLECTSCQWASRYTFLSPGGEGYSLIAVDDKVIQEALRIKGLPASHLIDL